MLIETATIMEWSLAIAGVIGALAGLVKASQCRKITICKVIECEKAQTTETEQEEEEETLGNDDFSKALTRKKNIKETIEEKV